MAFPTRTHVTSNNSSRVTSHTYSIGSPASGDMVVVFAACAASSNFTWADGTSAVNFTLPAGWTMLYERRNRVGSSVLGVFYKVCDGTEGASISVTMSVASTFGCVAHKFASGTYTGTPQSTSLVADGGTSADPASLTASWGSDDNVWIAAVCQDLGGVSTFPTNYTSNGGATGDAGGAPYAVMNTATRELATATENPGAFSLSTSTEFVVGTLVVRGAAASGPGSGVLAQYRQTHLLMEP
jgi:hypothetical protein